MRRSHRAQQEPTSSIETTLVARARRHRRRRAARREGRRDARGPHRARRAARPRWPPPRTISRLAPPITTPKRGMITTISRASWWSCPRSRIPPPSSRSSRLSRARTTCLRMKGFLEVTGKPMRLLVQGVGQRFRQQFDRAWAQGEARRGRLVVIGEKGIDREAVTAAIMGLRPAERHASLAQRDAIARRDRRGDRSRQTPAKMVFLSFSDSDLAGVANAWEEGKEGFPSLRLANLSALRHPFSIDRYVERVIAHAVSCWCALLGGLDYWRYGVEEMSRAARSSRLCARRRRRGTRGRTRGSRRPRPCRAPSSRGFSAICTTAAPKTCTSSCAFIAHRVAPP